VAQFFTDWMAFIHSSSVKALNGTQNININWKNHPLAQSFLAPLADSWADGSAVH